MLLFRLFPVKLVLLGLIAGSALLAAPAGSSSGANEAPAGGESLIGPAGGFQGLVGDVDCTVSVNSVDALKILRFVVDLSVAQTEPCPDIADSLPGLELIMGDVDCSGAVNSVDSLKILRFVVDLSVLQTEPCPDIGTPLQGFEGEGNIEGTVVNATNAEPIAGATVRLRENAAQACGGAIVETATSSSLAAQGDGGPGSFTFMNIAAGIYDLEVTAEGFIDSCREGVIVLGDTTTMLTVSLSPPLEAGELRIVLSWGEQPRDLDSHLWLPENDPYHICFADPGTQSVHPFAELDVDDIFSFGPETITITQRLDGQYVYAVHNFSGDINEEGPPITQSGAQVQVFGEAGLIRSFSVPTSGSGFWWHVFDMNGQTGQITPVNTIGGDPEPYAFSPACP